jgi:phosphohistidine phosphatase
MDLILWRHAEAVDLTEGTSDLERSLTPRGEKQALRMANWLDRLLPGATRVLVSPARRCEQTALALGRKYKLCPDLAPQASAQDLLAVAGWPSSRWPVLIIGHQPTLGNVIAQVFDFNPACCPVRKGAAWWIRCRERDGHSQTLVWAVQSPDMV